MGIMASALLGIVLPLALAAGWEVGVCVQNGLQLFPGIVDAQDGAGGVVVYWTDNRNGHFETYAARIRGSDGYLMWTREVSIPPGSYSYGHRLSPTAACDSDVGPVLCWLNYQKIDNYIFGAYVTKLNGATGEPLPLWGGTGGKSVRDSLTLPPVMCSDGSGGCIVAWCENARTAIHARRWNEYGQLRWTSTIYEGTTAARTVKIVPDGNGGACIGWIEDLLCFSRNWTNGSFRN